MAVALSTETGTDDKERVQLPEEMIEKFTHLSPPALIFARLLLNCQSYWIPLSTGCKNKEYRLQLLTGKRCPLGVLQPTNRY